MIRIPRLHAGDRMARFIEGADRRQAALFPESLDDYVGVDNPVRVVDAFVDALDLLRSALKVSRPGDVDGYLNQVNKF